MTMASLCVAAIPSFSDSSFCTATSRLLTACELIIELPQGRSIVTYNLPKCTVSQVIDSIKTDYITGRQSSGQTNGQPFRFTRSSTDHSIAPTLHLAHQGHILNPSKTLADLDFAGRTTVLQARQHLPQYCLSLLTGMDFHDPHLTAQDLPSHFRIRNPKRKRSQYILRNAEDEKRPRLDEEVQKGVNQYKPLTLRLRARLLTTAENAASYGMNVTEMRMVLNSLDLAFDDLCLK